MSSVYNPYKVVHGLRGLVQKRFQSLSEYQVVWKKPPKNTTILVKLYYLGVTFFPIHRPQKYAVLIDFDIFLDQIPLNPCEQIIASPKIIPGTVLHKIQPSP